MRGKTILRICEECKSLNREWIKYWMQEFRGKRPTHEEKKDCFHIFRERAALRLTLTKLDSCRQSAQLKEKR